MWENASVELAEIATLTGINAIFRGPIRTWKHSWIVCGASDASGIYGSTWGRMLVQLGAKNAMGFDNNSSTELYRPGMNPVTAYGFERSIVSATALTYS